MRKPTGGWLANSPWWLISAGFHAVLLLGATLVYMERLLALDGNDFQVVPCSTRLEAPIDYPRHLVERRSFIPPDEERPIPFEETLLAFDPGAEAVPSQEPGGDTPLKPFEVTSSALWMPEAGLRARRPADVSCTNLLRVGTGTGYGQRAETGSFRRSLTLRTGCCCHLTESAVLAALKWLARHQNSDGSWSAGHFGDACGCSGGGVGDFDDGVTGLSLLAFLGAGYTPFSREEYVDTAFPDRRLSFGLTVKRGIRRLTERQNADGSVGEHGPKPLYNHAIAALALSEAYGMTGLDSLRDAAQRAIDYLVAAQNPGRGWRYSATCGDNDTSVTGWAVMALKSAELSGLRFPKSATDGALAWLDEATETGGRGRTGYTGPGTGKVFIPGRNEQFYDHPTMSAVSVLSRIFIRRQKREPELTGVLDLSMDLPQWEPGKVDFYYWYYGSLALFQYDGPSGGLWSRWNHPMNEALIPHQRLRKDGCRNGSWDPEEDRWGSEGGRVYATALNAMTLEVYYRYAFVFGTQR